VWKLKKALYGLKQAPRQWHTKLKEVLVGMGFSPCVSDPSLYLKFEDGIWILVYVDDMLLIGSSAEALAPIKKQLMEALPMKDLGEVSRYLGMEIEQHPDSRTTTISQAIMIGKVLDRFKDYNIQEYGTPLQLANELRRADPEAPEEDIGQSRYRELVGCLMYVMICSRPDIAHALSVLSRFLDPTRHGQVHWKAALRVLGYLKATQEVKLTLGGDITNLTGHSDASWADDLTERRSSQGYCFDLGGGVVSWKAGLSPAIALSTCEAELYAGTAAAQEGLWLQHLLEELLPHAGGKPHLWCDNLSVVTLDREAAFQGRSKHIEARHYFLKDLVLQGDMTLSHIKGTLNVADVFTKPLSQEDHYRCMRQLGLSPLHRTPRGCVEN
jgi:hypothetical protein